VVRSKEEILATLDGRGRLDELPFSAGDVRVCGRRPAGLQGSHKTCDTIHKTGGRKMNDTVHLEGARCDGSRTAAARRAASFSGRPPGCSGKKAALRRKSRRPAPRTAPKTQSSVGFA